MATLVLELPASLEEQLRQAVTEGLGDFRMLTTQEVLTELLNFASGAGPHTRRRVADWVKALADDPKVTIIQQSSDTFQAGLGLYKQRPDKSYSLTDCVSMQAMRERGLTEALTHDHHFEQEGF